MSTQNNNESRPYNYKNIRPNGKFDTGHPTKYKQEYCQNIIEYFNSGNHSPIPFFSAYAREIKISEDTLWEWAKVHDDFSESIKICKSIQKELLIQGGLTGKFNPTAFIFTAKNITDMRDNVDQTVNINLNMSDYLTQIPDKTSELIECPDYTVIDNKKAESDV